MMRQLLNGTAFYILHNKCYKVIVSSFSYKVINGLILNKG